MQGDKGARPSLTPRVSIRDDGDLGFYDHLLQSGNRASEITDLARDGYAMRSGRVNDLVVRLVDQLIERLATEFMFKIRDMSAKDESDTGRPITVKSDGGGGFDE